MENHTDISETLSPRSIRILLLMILSSPALMIPLVYWFFSASQLGMFFSIIIIIFTIANSYRIFRKFFKQAKCEKCDSQIFNQLKQLFKQKINCSNCGKSY